jgi:hypothetical protein
MSSSSSATPDLSYAQLRTCLGSERVINFESPRLDDSAAALDVSEKKIEALQAAIERKRATVDASDHDAVDRFNTQLAAAKRRFRRTTPRSRRATPTPLPSTSALPDSMRTARRRPIARAILRR